MSYFHRTSQVLSLKEGAKDPEPDQKLQDLVNKTMWKKCCFSGDGEYVCAGSARQVTKKNFPLHRSFKLSLVHK